MKMKLCLGLCVSFLFSFSAHAKSRRSSDQGERRYRLPNYGMGGCGLGTLVFNPKDNSMGTQLSIAGGTDLGVSVASSVVVVAGGGTVAIGGSPFGWFLSGPSSAQSSSIVSGVSNCNDIPDDEDAMLKEQATFVAVNLESLAKESAQGDGDHLRAFADILGCGENSQYLRFAEISQQLQPQIFSDRVPESVAKRWIGQVRTNAELSSCLDR